MVAPHQARTAGLQTRPVNIEPDRDRSTATDSPAEDDDAPAIPQAEVAMAWRLVAAVLLTLTLVKPLGGIAIVGTVAFTFAAFLQLYLPVWRMDCLRRDYDFLGLHTRAWRTDVKVLLLLIAVTFPPYAVLHHGFVVYGREMLEILGLQQFAGFVPQMYWAPHWPGDSLGVGPALWWGAGICATHVLGVALPEETFYRGYLQPRLERLWPPHRRVFGVAIGRAAVVCCGLFALGHFLGEWNPLRLGPFFPALIFAWQRNKSGSIMGAISYHAACNIFGEILFSLYRAG